MHWATVVLWLTLIMSKRGPPSSISILVLQSQTALYSVVKWLLLITIIYLSHCLFLNLFLCGQLQSRLRLRVLSCHRSQQSTRKRRHTSSVLSHSVVSSSLLQPTKFLCPWNFPDKNTGVVFCFLLQGIFPIQKSNLISCVYCIAGGFFTSWAIEEAPLHSVIPLKIR